MTRIDFYQIDSGETHLGFACRLIENIYRKGHRIHVHASDSEQAAMLDDMLWTHRPAHFIPHCLAASGHEAPITISHDHEPNHHDEVLVNLSGLVPDFFSRFERVAEVVPLEESGRQAARANYKFYKDRGYPLDYHKMTGRHG